jgi:hypothetical protein
VNEVSDLQSVTGVSVSRESGRLFPAKLGVLLHYLLHQLLDDYNAILLAREFCDLEALLHGTTVSRCHHVPRLSA